MLYFPDDDEKDIEYGTTFWNSDIPNSSNERLKDDIKYSEFKKQNKVLFKTPFVSNCLYGLLEMIFLGTQLSH